MIWGESDNEQWSLKLKEIYFRVPHSIWYFRVNLHFSFRIRIPWRSKYLIFVLDTLTTVLLIKFACTSSLVTLTQDKHANDVLIILLIVKLHIEKCMTHIFDVRIRLQFFSSHYHLSLTFIVNSKDSQVENWGYV